MNTAQLSGTAGRVVAVEGFPLMEHLTERNPTAFPNRGNRVHVLKVQPGPYRATDAGVKLYEIRRTDRDFRVGDVLVLREWEPDGVCPGWGDYTGKFLTAVVGYISQAGTWGLPEDVCVLGLVHCGRALDGWGTFYGVPFTKWADITVGAPARALVR